MTFPISFTDAGSNPACTVTRWSSSEAMTARRESPRPADIARSTSGPRPNTSWLPSARRMTWPDAAVLTCAATGPV